MAAAADEALDAIKNGARRCASNRSRASRIAKSNGEEEEEEEEERF